MEALLARHAGPARARELAAKDAYDDALDAALAEAGFADVALGDGTGPLEAALVVEAVARAGGRVAAGASYLVAPAVTGRRLPGPVALLEAERAEAPVRFAAQARTVLVLDGERARIVTPAPGAARALRSSYGHPVGRFAAGALAGGEALGPGSGARLAAWWRLALALEAVGAMEAALAVTVEYTKRRRQFGRAIASFQAVQHRLAACRVALEGARWLAREAVWRQVPPGAIPRTPAGVDEPGPAELAAQAAAATLDAAGRVFAETHQLSGAMGFTHAHELHVWSMRLPALRLELGGVAAQRRAAARARWAGAPG